MYRRGGLQYNWQKTPDAKKAWISTIVASGTCLISIFLGIPLLKRNVQRDLDALSAELGKEASPDATIDVAPGGKDAGDAQALPAPEGTHLGKEGATTTAKGLQVLRESRVWRAAFGGLDYDIHEVRIIHPVHAARC